MLRNIIVGLVLLVVLVLAVGVVLPDKAHVERSVKIEAPASQVFALVNGFRSFAKWSPWQDKDPTAKVMMSGPALGVGAHYEWSGNKAVGAGTQEIVASTPNTQVKTKLIFAGFDQPSISVFELEPMQDGVRVTWSLDVPLGGNPLAHYFGPLMQRMVAPDYEAGLAKLKTLAEAGSKTDFAGLDAELAETKAVPYAYVSASSSTDTDAIGKALMMAYGQVGLFIKANGLKEAGAPLAVTRRWDDEAHVYEFDAGIPVDRNPADGAPLAAAAPAVVSPDLAKAKIKGQEKGGAPAVDVKVALTYAGLALRVEHHGAYRDLPKTYDKISAFKKAYALDDNGLPWEQYVSDPGNTPEAQLLTEIWVPVK